MKNKQQYTRNKRRHRDHHKRTHHRHTRSHKNHHQRDDTLRTNNFYLWANRKWLNEVPKTLPRELKYIRPLDNFKLIQDEMYKNVLTIVREYTRNKSAAARQMKVTCDNCCGFSAPFAASHRRSARARRPRSPFSFYNQPCSIASQGGCSCNGKPSAVCAAAFAAMRNL